MIESKFVNHLSVVVMQVKKENYLLEVINAKEIYIPGKNIIPIPMADKTVVGIIDIRGDIYTIISLRHKIHPTEEDYGLSEKSRILLLEYQGMKIGLLVDSVLGVKDFPVQAFDKDNIIIETNIDWKYIKSIALLDDQAYILLNLELLIPPVNESFEEKIIPAPRSTPEEPKLTPKTPVKAKSRTPAAYKPQKRFKVPTPIIPEMQSVETRPLELDKTLGITPLQKDLLMELGNIGTGNAITALSQMINKRIDVDFTQVKIITFEKLGIQFGKRADLVCGIFSHIEQPSQSTILQIFDQTPLLKLVSLLAGKELKIKIEDVKSKKDLDAFGVSTIVEMGNIMAGHYASALADLLGIKLVPDVPDFTMSKAGTLGKFLSSELKSISKYLVMIRTGIKIVDLKLNGTFFLIPDRETLEILFNKLGMEYSEEELTSDSKNKVFVQSDKLDLRRFELSPEQSDALKEVGNIGSGNAANALAKMLDTRVDINVPDVEVVAIDEFAGKLGRKTQKFFTCWSNVVGVTRATVLTVFKVTDMTNLIGIITSQAEKVNLKKIKKFEDFSEFLQSAMKEVGHILGSHYTNALGNLLGITLMTEPPDVNVDVGKNLFTFLKEEIGLLQELSLVITTKVIIKEQEIEGSFLFIPDLNTLQELLDALRGFYE